MFKTPFKSRAHYVFNYKPRYFNERKERIEKLQNDVKREEEEKLKDDYDIRLSKNALIDQWQRSKSKESDRKTTPRLDIIIALLIGFFSWLFELHTLI